MSTTKRSMQEARRLIGGQMILDGYDLSEIADALHVAPSTVYQWKDRLEQDGWAGLHRKGKSGRSSQWTDEEKAQLKEIVRAGAVAYGFPNEPWTSKRVRLVIFERFHVEYNSNYVCEILRSLDLSPQVHSAKRSQAAIEHWKRSLWPVIKKIVDRGRDPDFMGRERFLFVSLSPLHLGSGRRNTDLDRSSEGAMFDRPGLLDGHAQASRS